MCLICGDNMFEIINNTNKKISELEESNKYVLYLVDKLNLNNAIFNIIFITNEEIKSINKEYRNIDKITDVISFALEDNEKIIDSNLRVLGDIYISYEKIITQSSEFENTVLEEIKFLITHGILHLLGFDHMNEKDEKVMFDYQYKLIDEYNK